MASSLGRTMVAGGDSPPPDRRVIHHHSQTTLACTDRLVAARLISFRLKPYQLIKLTPFPAKSCVFDYFPEHCQTGQSRAPPYLWNP